MTQLNAYYPKEKLKEVRPIEAQDKGHFEKFEGKVDGAQAVIQGQDASHVVALNSTVHLEDLDSGRQFVYTLVSSNSVDIAKNKVSAIAPLGKSHTPPKIWRRCRIQCACRIKNAENQTNLRSSQRRRRDA